MKQIFIKPFNELKGLGCPVYAHTDDNGNFSIDAEAPNSGEWADYYGDIDCPRIAAVLDKHSMFAEWVNPGRLSVYKA